MFRNQFLKGKSAIVTGSTSGIGLAIATALSKAGANVLINGLTDSATVENLRYDLEEKYHNEVVYSSADMSKPDEICSLYDLASKAFGKVDILVNNAGIQYVSPIVDFPSEKWSQILAINLSSAFYTTKLVLPAMQQNEWGRIINIASAHGVVASPFKSAYVSAKHGLVGLTKVTALETARTNVTCNAICPGYVRTPLVEKQIVEQAKAHNISQDRVIEDIILKAQPNKNFIQLEHLADFVLFLCSESASGMTGEILSIDGGWTAQ